MTPRPALAPGRRGHRSRPRSLRGRAVVRIAAPLAIATACSGGADLPTAASGPALSRSCAGAPTTSLAVAQAVVLNCNDGGSSTLLTGGGASYLIVVQLATDNTSAHPATYVLTASGSPASGNRVAASAVTSIPPAPDAQTALDFRLRAQERAAGTPAGSLLRAGPDLARAAAQSVPAVGSLRDFRVLTDYTSSTDVWKTVTARLAYVGANVMLYADTLSPDAGFSAADLQRFGDYFDRTLYPLDISAFGATSDVDGNGHVIMLMSPAVNAGTPRNTCYTQGYVAGFFNAEDFNGASDPNSNRGEIFYSLVADPEGRFGCVHSTSEVSSMEPAVFLHELQHLINYSHHVAQGGGQQAASWVNEGLSIVAEELGSQYYEDRCPPPACRSTPGQLLPDSSLGFARDFSIDSYFFAGDPDTVSVTQHHDGEMGTAWRGGAWALLRWLGDHEGAGFYQRLESASGSGMAAIESAAGGQSFGTLFANFGLALYTDSLSGEPRSTAPVADRFETRNMRALWASVSPSYGGPAFPIPVHAVSAAAQPMTLMPGGMAFWRLDTPAGAAVDTLRFTAPGGASLDPSLNPQLAIFRLPPGH
jgi:hypothetical protein